MAFKMKLKSPLFQKVGKLKVQQLKKVGRLTKRNYEGSFEQAFANARKSGAKEFIYKGKKYNTKIK